MRLCKILAVLALALLFTLPGRAVEPYKLRIGWVVAGADFTTLMFASPELAPQGRQDLHPGADPFRGHLDRDAGAQHVAGAAVLRRER